MYDIEIDISTVPQNLVAKLCDELEKECKPEENRTINNGIIIYLPSCFKYDPSEIVIDFIKKHKLSTNVYIDEDKETYINGELV